MQNLQKLRLNKKKKYAVKNPNKLCHDGREPRKAFFKCA